ncbi:MAG: hypothetical protein NT133_09475 [Alphaproteobacteria bacterium]|nr:hypothetical protein [Alphaproteobacteria bacterium]
MIAVGAAQHEAGGAVPDAGELQPPRRDPPEPADLADHRTRPPRPQHRLHGGEAGIVVPRFDQDEAAGVEPVGEQAGGMQVRDRGADPEHFPPAGDRPHQAGQEPRPGRPGLGVDPHRRDLVQHAERQPAAGQAGINRDRAERPDAMPGLRLKRRELGAQGGGNWGYVHHLFAYRFPNWSRESSL